MTAHSTFVIAEAGSCHDGHLDKALELVHIAKSVGANAVKFQWVSSVDRIVERRRAPEYKDAYQLIAFPFEWHLILSQACEREGIEYMCTTYLPEDIPLVEPFVKRFKIASFEARDEEFIEAHLEYNKRLIISTGMGLAVPSYIDRYVRTDYLHCVSAYPCPVTELNLSVMRDGYYDGLSDHTVHPLTGALAVAAGARIIEFHLRLRNTSYKNADFEVARDPDMAYRYLTNIRLAEKVMGEGEKRVMDVEKPMLRYRVKA